MLPPALKLGSAAPGRAGCLDRSEFAAEFQRSFRALWLVAVGILADRAHAEDAVQDAAIIALQKLDSFTPGTSFAAWMSQMVRNVALNKLRKERRRQGPSLDDPTRDLMPATAARGGPRRAVLNERGEIAPDQGHFDDWVMRALGTVNSTARACLLLRTIEGLEYTEIARLLEIPPGTAMSHVHRTRMFLRTKLADAGQAGGGSRGAGQ